jgi:hypothetical protein
MLIIGRKDRAELPLLGVANVPVKIDSGAYSCSIHCDYVQEELINGKVVLCVVFFDKNSIKYSGDKLYFQTFKKKKVKSSTGEEQERYFVQLSILLFGKEYPTDFSLTKRNGLRNPILLGRKLINNNFLIDTTKINLSFRASKLSNK